MLEEVRSHPDEPAEEGEARGEESRCGGGRVKPYYDHGGITIYHGDCGEILPALGKFDLLLTDPPYGIGRDGKERSTSRHGGHKGYAFEGWDQSRPDSQLLASALGAARDGIVWGGNYFADLLPPMGGWLVWDKGQRINQADAELAWSTRMAPIRVIVINRAAIASDGAVHPTQKPLKLMAWCLGHFPEAASVIDPFMGSGTTLRAAKDSGKRAVGIERVERYCEIAAKRLAQETLF